LVIFNIFLPFLIILNVSLKLILNAAKPMQKYHHYGAYGRPHGQNPESNESHRHHVNGANIYRPVKVNGHYYPYGRPYGR
jgi:hypothetical protein